MYSAFVHCVCTLHIGQCMLYITYCVIPYTVCVCVYVCVCMCVYGDEQTNSKQNYSCLMSDLLDWMGCRISCRMPSDDSQELCAVLRGRARTCTYTVHHTVNHTVHYAHYTVNDEMMMVIEDDDFRIEGMYFTL